MEQFERAKRYLSRIEKIYEGVFSSEPHDTDCYDDDVISFFIHCHHIRDWIIHLNKLDITTKQVDNYIDSHKALRICADLANGSKHCQLTRTLRTEKQPYIAGKERRYSEWSTSSGGGEIMQCQYSIISNNQFHDALALAKECISLWESYQNQLQETYNKQVKLNRSATQLKPLN